MLARRTLGVDVLRGQQRDPMAVLARSAPNDLQWHRLPKYVASN
jgi:hypothetical protein